MKKLSLAIALLFAPLVAQAWPWSDDMANQISVKPQASPNKAAPGATLFPSRSVPAPGTATSSITVKDADAAVKLANPVAADAKSVETGHQLFTVYCTPCHGTSGTGDGKVGEKLILRPFDLTSDTLAEQPDGYIFGMMTFGGAVMPVYANDLSPTERWHVINYIRKGLRNAPAAQAAASAQ
ncbi:MAG: c-type cytochrome [Gallionellaceae bacterium]|jgi:mono/diheme cytochrome c family protein|nr:c-type cytochrome [Gallionellaceae bacterium]